MTSLVTSYTSLANPLRELSRYLEKKESQDLLIDPKFCRILAPIYPTRNIMCVGKNYSEHVKEIANKLSPNNSSSVTAIDSSSSKYATFFTKATSDACVIGPHDTIPNHSNITKYLDYEVELAVIIGTKGKGVNIDTNYK